MRNTNSVDKVFEHGQWIAPEQKLVFAPPDYPKVEYTYTEFGKRVNRLGSALEEFDLEYARKAHEMGSRVAVVEWNTTRYQELMHAVMMKGATINTINIRLPP